MPAPLGDGWLDAGTTTLPIIAVMGDSGCVCCALTGAATNPRAIAEQTLRITALMEGFGI